MIRGLDVQNQDHQGITALVPAIGGGVIDVFVPVVWIMVTQFLKSRFEVFVENFQFSIICG